MSLLSTWENHTLYQGLGLALSAYTIRLLRACHPLNQSRELQPSMMSLENCLHRHQGERLPHLLSFLLQPKGFDFFAREPEVPLLTLPSIHASGYSSYSLRALQYSTELT